MTMYVQYLDPQSALEFGVFVVFLVPGGGFSGRFSFVYGGGLQHHHHTFGATADRSSLLTNERAILGIELFLSHSN